jgi:hypothetical protein
MRDYDLSVCAKIDQRRGLPRAIETCREYPHENIAANEATQAWKEAAAIQRYQVEMWRLEGGPRKRFDIEPAVEMMHRGVSGDQTIAGPISSNLIYVPSNWSGKIAASQRGLDARHDVGAEDCLWIERSSNSENVSGGEIKMLRDHGGRAEVNGNAATFSGGEDKRRVIT